MGGVFSLSSDAASLSSTSVTAPLSSLSSGTPSLVSTSANASLSSPAPENSIAASSQGHSDVPTSSDNITTSARASVAVSQGLPSRNDSPSPMSSSAKSTTSIKANGPSGIASPSGSTFVSTTSVETTASSASARQSPSAKSTGLGTLSTATTPTGPADTAPTGPADTKGLGVSFTGTTTSTITDAPETTLKSASFVPIVSEGKTSLSAPPLLTVLSTSTEPDGVLVTYTHVVANGPTGFSQALTGSGRPTFFRNAGAVAGVFLVVGIILTAMVSFALFIFCRRRRRRREAHRRWLISINRPRRVDLDDPFATPPPMVQITQEWDISGHSQRNSTNGLGLYNMPSPQRIEPVSRKRFDSLDSNQIGLAITTAQSSPSIYPASLPPVNEDGAGVVSSPSPPPFRRSTDLTTPPPRPRRSHLRVPPPILSTPPESETSHSPVSESATAVDIPREQSPTPRSPKVNELIGRRTLLDVRPLSQEGIPTQF